MKKLLLSLMLLALLAAPSFAYVQSGQLLQKDPQSDQNSANARQKPHRWMDPSPGTNPTPEPVFEPLTDGATRPIPEPGTMVLASLGLLALGVSRARHRGH